jgi:Methyltransferase domain
MSAGSRTWRPGWGSGSGYDTTGVEAAERRYNSELGMTIVIRSVYHPTMASALYDTSFYTGWAEETRASAEAVVPLILRLTKAESVVDFGSGSGLWLREFSNAGVDKIQGYDGPWIKTEDLHIPPECFTHRDLTTPISVDKRFDLAVSLEVAEHLPNRAADTFITSMVSAADVVVFGASIRKQGGCGHVNEQWPSYWIEKFAAHGYVAIDAIRPEIWDEPRILVFYRQNIGIFVRKERLSDYPELHARHVATGGKFPDLVHPLFYEKALRRADDVRGLVIERAKDALGPLRPVLARTKQYFRSA